MPADNPQVGETWEMSDTHTGNTVQGVVIAVGGNVLVMARTGRRITLSFRSFLLLWTLRVEAPEPRICTTQNCESIAYFRIIGADQEPSWVCANHTPQGVATFFPSDDVRSPTEFQVECPDCHSSGVEQRATWQVRGRSFCRHHCSNCQAAWYLVLGRGTEADGRDFAEDLPSLAAQLDRAEIRLGSLARQYLSRAMGLWSASHLGGYALRVTNQFGDNAALVIQRGREVPFQENLTQSEPITVLPEAEQGEGDKTLTIGSTWRHRRTDNHYVLCQVKDLSDGLVDFSIIWRELPSAPIPLFKIRGDFFQMGKDRFLEYFDLVGPQRNLMDPRKGSFWRHIETLDIIRISHQTLVHRREGQVPHDSLNGFAAVTSSSVFQNLYRELPFPPTKVPWVLGRDVFRPLSFRSAEDYREAMVTLEGGEGSLEVSLPNLYRDYTPMVFEGVTTDPLLFPVRAKSIWRHEEGEDVRVVDIGCAGAQEFVRFDSPSRGLQILPLDVFGKLYHYQEPISPTKIGDEWSLKNQTYKVTSVNLDDSTITLSSEHEANIVSFRKLLDQYTRFERRSAFSMLDDED